MRKLHAVVCAALLIASALLLPTRAMAGYLVQWTGVDGSIHFMALGPITLPGTAADFYAYNVNHGASANTGLEQSDTLVQALVRQADGSVALLAIVDARNDTTGGNLQGHITVSPPQSGLGFLVEDDPGDTFRVDDPATGAASVAMTWAPCCTDGFVFGPFNGFHWQTSFEITASSGINRFEIVGQQADGSLTELWVPASAANTIVFIANQPPTADIAALPALHTGDLVTLDGSGSTDPEGDALAYHWTLTPPPGSSATLSDDTAVMPTFTPDVDGDYQVQLVVNDGQFDSQPATVTVNAVNAPPVADAGPDQALLHLQTVVQLDGTGSYDPDNDALTAYHWTLSVPAGSNATLDDPSAANPSFKADVYGDYVATLVVTDAFDAVSAPDSVTLSFTNVAPMADAGPNLAGVVGHTVTLAGSGSDENGDVLTYVWSLTTVPAGSAAALTGADTTSPSFTPDVTGTYVAQLIVNDGLLDSVPATDSIEVITVQDAASQTLMELIDQINGQPPTDSSGMPVFRHKHVARALTHELQVALKLTDRGRFRPALAILQGLERKSDGCARRGHADHNDWITSCEVQAVVAGLLDEAEGYLHEALAGHRPMHRHHRWHRHAWHARHHGLGDHDVGIGGGRDERGDNARSDHAHRR